MTSTETPKVPMSDRLIELEKQERQLAGELEAAQAEAREVSTRGSRAIADARHAWATGQVRRLPALAAAKGEARDAFFAAVASGDGAQVLATWMAYRLRSAEIGAEWQAIANQYRASTGHLALEGPKHTNESFAAYLDHTLGQLEQTRTNTVASLMGTELRELDARADAGFDTGQPAAPVGVFHSTRKGDRMSIGVPSTDGLTVDFHFNPQGYFATWREDVAEEIRRRIRETPTDGWFITDVTEQPNPWHEVDDQADTEPDTEPEPEPEQEDDDGPDHDEPAATDRKRTRRDRTTPPDPDAA